MKSKNEVMFSELLLNPHDQKLHDKLLVSSDDIAIAQFCADVLLKKSWHAQPWERRGTVYQQQTAFTTTLITAYARAFTRSKGWPMLPSRLLNYDDSEAALHHHILTLRHQVYAHSDSNRYSIKPFSIRDTPITIIRRPALRLTAPEVTLFLVMTNKLLSAIKDRIQSLLTSAKRIPLETDETVGSEAQFVVHRRKGESPRKRHGSIIIELEPEPPHLPPDPLSSG